MTFWLDAQLPPGLAAWLAQTFAVEARAVRDLDLLRATDRWIFELARARDVTLISKDIDFVDLVQTLGPPPCFVATFPRAGSLLADGRAIVEIADA